MAATTPLPVPDPTERATLTVPEVARILGLSRNAGYEAAARGDLPTIRLGRRLLVPTAAFRRLLGIDA